MVRLAEEDLVLPIEFSGGTIQVWVVEVAASKESDIVKDIANTVFDPTIGRPRSEPRAPPGNSASTAPARLRYFRCVGFCDPLFREYHRPV